MAVVFNVEINCSVYDDPSNSNITFPALDYTLADTYKVVAGSISFLLILPFVLFHFKVWPIGTTAAILLGAILMIATTVLSQQDFYTILGEEGNLRTIFLLLGMMILSRYLEREGIIQKLLTKMLKRNISFPNYLWRVNLLTFIVAAFFTNDAACVILTPLILKHWHSQKRAVEELETLLLAIATSANIGSVVTIFGNPQMALIASTTEKPIFLKSQLDLLRSITYLGPPALVAYFINLGCLIGHSKFLTSSKSADEFISLSGGTETTPTPTSEPDTHHYRTSRYFGWFLGFVLVAMLALFFVQTDTVRIDIGILPMAAAALIMASDALINKINPNLIIAKTDWGVILMFFSIFVWLAGVNATRVPRAIWKAIGLAGQAITDVKSIAILSCFVIFGSNVFSNVPLTIIVLEQLEPCVDQLDLILYLAWCSTVAGNLTLFGSVANLIVAQKAHETLNFRLTFWAYFKYGFLTSLVIVAIGVVVIYGLLQI